MFMLLRDIILLILLLLPRLLWYYTNNIDALASSNFRVLFFATTSKYKTFQKPTMRTTLNPLACTLPCFFYTEKLRTSNRQRALKKVVRALHRRRNIFRKSGKKIVLGIQSNFGQWFNRTKHFVKFLLFELIAKLLVVVVVFVHQFSPIGEKRSLPSWRSLR